MGVSITRAYLVGLKVGGGVRNKPLAAYHKKLPLIPNSQKNDVSAQWGAIYAPHASLEKCQLSEFSSIWPIFKIYIPAYQSMRNFMLISKMYTFVYLSGRFFELWPSKGRKRPVLGKTGLFWPKTYHNSKNLQDRYTNVYIFEISIKFRIEWWAGIYILKMFQKSHD